VITEDDTGFAILDLTNVKFFRGAVVGSALTFFYFPLGLPPITKYCSLLLLKYFPLFPNTI